MPTGLACSDCLPADTRRLTPPTISDLCYLSLPFMLLAMADRTGVPEISERGPKMWPAMIYFDFTAATAKCDAIEAKCEVTACVTRLELSVGAIAARRPTSNGGGAI